MSALGTRGRQSTLLLRVASAAVGLPFLLFLTWLGTTWFVALTSLVAVLGVWEFQRLATSRSVRPVPVLLGSIWTVALVVSGLYRGDISALIVAAGVLGLLVWPLLRRGVEGALEAWALAVAGPMYVGWSLSHAVTLRQLDQGWEWVFFVLLSTFATDTSAFFVGRLLGRSPMAPSISPGKTWEGAVGGFVGAIVASLVLAWLLGLSVSMWQVVLLGVLVGIFAQVGDLAESLLKRAAGVKDAGALVPGHGGILDRLDSVVFTVVVVYYVLVWVIY